MLYAPWGQIKPSPIFLLHDAGIRHMHKFFKFNSINMVLILILISGYQKMHEEDFHVVTGPGSNPSNSFFFFEKPIHPTVSNQIQVMCLVVHYNTQLLL